jgi:hypothetical protein
MSSKEYEQIEKEINLLVFEQGNGTTFWRHVKEINAMFRSTRFPSAEERVKLWNKLSQECDQMKLLRQSLENEVQAKSKYWFESIRHDILSSKPNDLFGFDSPNVEEMKILSNKLRDAGQELSDHKTEMTFQHKQELFQMIQEVRKDQDAWWVDLKKNIEQKQNNFRERIKTNLEKNRERLNIQIAALERHETALNILQEKIDASSGGDWLDRALSEYMPDLEKRIENIKESIREIEKWIEEDEAKL